MIKDADVTNDEDFLTYIEADCCKNGCQLIQMCHRKFNDFLGLNQDNKHAC
jgi:hypothetical protein